MGKTAIEEKIIEESECLIEVFEEKKGNAPFDTLTFANSSQFLQISLKFVFIYLKLSFKKMYIWKLNVQDWK